MKPCISQPVEFYSNFKSPAHAAMITDVHDNGFVDVVVFSRTRNIGFMRNIGFFPSPGKIPREHWETAFCTPIERDRNGKS